MINLQNIIYDILEKDKNLDVKYDFSQDTEELALLNLASNTAKAKEISTLISEFIKWLTLNTTSATNYSNMFYLQNEMKNNVFQEHHLDEIFYHWISNYYKNEE